MLPWFIMQAKWVPWFHENMQMIFCMYLKVYFCCFIMACLNGYKMEKANFITLDYQKMLIKT